MSSGEDSDNDDGVAVQSRQTSWKYYHELKKRMKKHTAHDYFSTQIDKISLGRVSEQSQLALRPHAPAKKKERKDPDKIYARVWAREARDLVATDVNLLDGYAASDPLLEIQIGDGEPVQTRHIIKNLNPKWDQRIVCTCQELLWNTSITDVDFTVTVFDKDLLSEDDPIGTFSWNILDLVKNRKPVDPEQKYLRVTVHRALGIQAGDADGFSDPYAKLEFSGMSCATQVHKRTLCPEFDEADYWFPIPKEQDLRLSFETDWREMEMTPAILRAGRKTERRVKVIMSDSFELLCEAFRVYSMLADLEAEDLDEDYAAQLRCAKPSWAQTDDGEEAETISFKEFIAFCDDTKILNKKLGISRRTLKEIFRRVNTETEPAGGGDGDGGQFRTQGDTQLERGEFMECLLYLSGLRYRTLKDPAKQIEMLIDELIEPNLTKPNPEGIVRVNINPPDLRVSIWDCDAVGDDDFLGEAYISLGEAARKDITKKSAMEYGRRWPLEKRPGHMNRFERVSGTVYVTTRIVQGDEDEYGDGYKNEGFHRFEFDDWYKLEYHEDMEGEVEPEDMSGEVRLTGTLLVPKALIAKEDERIAVEKANEEERENDLMFQVHAVDEWSSKSFPLKICATDPDFKWLANVVTARYDRFLKPRGRVRSRESGLHHVQQGTLTPYNMFTQLPPGTDKLGAPPHPLMSKVNGRTKVRDILQDGDHIWVQFQNKKAKNVIAGLTQLLKEQKAVDANRRWLRRLCREEEVKIQVQIAQRFKRLQEEDGKTIVQIFEDFDDDGGGTIDHDELREGFDDIGIELSEEQFQKMLTIWDESGDGEIDYEEFADMFERIQKMLDEDHRRPLIHFDVYENTGEIRCKPEIGKKFKRERVKEEDKSFQLDSSVFAERKMEADSQDYYETPDMLRKALLEDIKHAHRIKGLFDRNDFGICQSILQDNYLTLSETFRKYCCDEKQNGYFMISWNSFSKWCSDASIIDKRNCRIRDIDQVFVKVNAQTRGVDQNHSKALTRFEFIEAVVRLSQRRYRTLSTGPDKLRAFIEKHIIACVDPLWAIQKFREEHLYTEAVHQVFYKRIIAIKKLYKEAAASDGPKEDYVELMSLKEFMGILRKVKIISKKDFKPVKAIHAFAQSQMMTLDEQKRDTKDKRRDSHETMTLVEFLEALCRIAWIHPRVSGDSIAEKLEGLLALLFEDAKKTQSNVLSSMFGGGKKKGAGGFAGMFGKKK